jgi:adenosylhomocysteine nucleosidase
MDDQSYKGEKFMIAIIGAMQQEVDELLKLCENVEEQTVHGNKFYTGRLSQTDVVVALSGVAKVAAAMTTTCLFENFDVSGVINIGTAGGLKSEQEVLDVVVSSEVAHHDVDITAFGIKRGFGERFSYKAFPPFVEVVSNLIKDKEHRVWIGPMVSGDQFIHRQQQVENIFADFPNADCVEMEAAAIAQVSEHYKVPFVVIRSLSDIAVRDDNHLSFEEYLSVAAKRSAHWVYLAIDAIAACV